MWVEPAFADQRFRIVIGDISSEFARPVWLAGSKPTPGLSSSKLLSPCASFCSQAKYRRAAVSDIAFFPGMTRSSSLHPVTRAKGGSGSVEGDEGGSRVRAKRLELFLGQGCHLRAAAPRLALPGVSKAVRASSR